MVQQCSLHAANLTHDYCAWQAFAICQVGLLLVRSMSLIDCSAGQLLQDKIRQVPGVQSANAMADVIALWLPAVRVALPCTLWSAT